jgi:hypothetical protein
MSSGRATIRHAFNQHAEALSAASKAYTRLDDWLQAEAEVLAERRKALEFRDYRRLPCHDWP